MATGRDNGFPTYGGEVGGVVGGVVGGGEVGGGVVGGVVGGVGGVVGGEVGGGVVGGVGGEVGAREAANQTGAGDIVMKVGNHRSRKALKQDKARMRKVPPRGTMLNKGRKLEVPNDPSLGAGFFAAVASMLKFGRGR